MKTKTIENSWLGWTKGDFRKKYLGYVMRDLILIMEKDLNL